VEVVIGGDGAAVAALAADVVVRVLRERPTPVLGLATGTSPLGVYRLLIERCRAGEVSFAHAAAVLLDEYIGLPPGHPEGYRSVIRRELVDHVDLPAARLFGPDVWAPDIAAACADYDRRIAELGGVDVQLLGIGADGHIGFNEPGSSLGSRTRVKTLTALTRNDNARFFESPDDVPCHVVTQGLGTIGEARHLLLIATGEHKADAIARAVEGPVSAMCPASVLQFHPHATVIVDESAAGRLAHAEYYRETYAGKPAWQRL
jgi:glucosamine-6-phosphate deaminase